ncbi:cystatin-11-like, partial [Nannospalax galili]
MMNRPWKVLYLLWAVLVALMAFSYQKRKTTFIKVEEVNAVETLVKKALQYVTDAYNEKSEDMYNFRILRILKIEKQVTDHIEYHISVDMQRTTCLKNETSSCEIQEGALYK